MSCRDGAAQQRTPRWVQDHRVDTGDRFSVGIPHDDMLRGESSGYAARHAADLQVSCQRPVYQALGPHAQCFPALLGARQSEECQYSKQRRVQGELQEPAGEVYDSARGQGTKKV